MEYGDLPERIRRIWKLNKKQRKLFSSSISESIGLSRLREDIDLIAGEIEVKASLLNKLKKEASLQKQSNFLIVYWIELYFANFYRKIKIFYYKFNFLIISLYT